MPSIAEIAINDDRFDILVAALQFVDAQLPGTNLVATLSSASTDVTVFAPTDAAFAALADDLGYTGSLTDESAVTTFLATTLGATTLRDVILYHVSPEGKTLAEVAALDEVETLNGATFSPDGVTLVDGEPDLLDPSLVVTNIEATNGIIHAIDRVLLPSDLPGNDTQTITDIVVASGSFDNVGTDFDILLNSVVAADLAGVLDDAAADFTVFAPTDDAFVGLAKVLGFGGSGEEAAFAYIVEALTLLSKGGDPIPLLTDILLYHVSPESLQASQVLTTDPIETVLGVDLRISGTTLRDQDPDIANPALVTTDILASNGIIHAIDGVLIPVNLLKSDGSNDVDFIISDDRGRHTSTGLDNDYMDLNGGADDARAGEGNDVILGGTGADRLKGQDGADFIAGENGRDTLFGDKGADILSGGKGRDTLEGGQGADIFVFEEGAGVEIITDFRNGVDRIDLSDLGFANFAAFDAAANIRQAGDDVLIVFDAGGRIRVEDLRVALIADSDFIFG
jgi:serralysin